MKKATLLLLLLYGLCLSAQTVRIVNTDRQKIDSLLYRNDSLVIKIQNDVKRSLYLPGGAGGLEAEYLTGDGDITMPKYYYSDRNVTLTLRNDLPISSGTAFRSTHIDSTTTVLPDAGMTFIGDGQDVSQGFIVDSLSLATSYKVADNVVIVDGVYKPFLPPSPPANLYTNLDAANPEDETNATTGWATSQGSPTVASTNSGATPTNGDYYLRFEHEAADNVSNVTRIALPNIENGDTFTVKLDVNRIARPSNSGNSFVFLRDSSSNTLTSSGNLATDPGWNEVELTTTATTTVTYLEIGFGSGADTGDVIGIDNIRIVKN